MLLQDAGKPNATETGEHPKRRARNTFVLSKNKDIVYTDLSTLGSQVRNLIYDNRYRYFPEITMKKKKPRIIDKVCEWILTQHDVVNATDITSVSHSEFVPMLRDIPKCQANGASCMFVMTQQTLHRKAFLVGSGSR